MQNIVVSIAMRHNVFTIILLSGGVLEAKYTEKIKDTRVAESKYLSTIYAFTVALRLLRNYVEQNKAYREVCFELSNSIFIGWVEKMYSKEAYQEEFMNAMELLQEIPIKYMFYYAKKPRALAYMSSETESSKLSGLDVE